MTQEVKESRTSLATSSVTSVLPRPFNSFLVIPTRELGLATHIMCIFACFYLLREVFSSKTLHLVKDVFCFAYRKRTGWGLKRRRRRRRARSCRCCRSKEVLVIPAFSVKHHCCMHLLKRLVDTAHGFIYL